MNGTACIEVGQLADLPRNYGAIAIFASTQTEMSMRRTPSIESSVRKESGSPVAHLLHGA